LGWLFLGFLTVQTYDYYTHPAKDRPAFSALVYLSAFLVIIENISEAFAVFCVLASDWGKPNDSEIVSIWSPASVIGDLLPLFAALSALFVQCFFIWRIWRFCSIIYGRLVKLIVAVMCFFFILLAFAAVLSTITTILITLLPVNFSLGFVEGTVFGWIVPSAVVDVAITISMIIILCHSRSSASSGETYTKINRLLLLTIQTGFLTSFFAVLTIPLFTLGTRLYSLLWFPLGKSYIITLLANLNSRASQPSPAHTKLIDRVAMKKPKVNIGAYQSTFLRPMRKARHSFTLGADADLQRTL